MLIGHFHILQYVHIHTYVTHWHVFESLITISTHCKKKFAKHRYYIRNYLTLISLTLLSQVINDNNIFTINYYVNQATINGWCMMTNVGDTLLR